MRKAEEILTANAARLFRRMGVKCASDVKCFAAIVRILFPSDLTLESIVRPSPNLYRPQLYGGRYANGFPMVPMENTYSIAAFGSAIHEWND